MNHDPRSNVAASVAILPSNVPPVTAPRPPVDLDDHVRLACAGDRNAAGVVARELRPRLVSKVLPVLGARFSQDADDVVQDLLVAMLEGRIRPKRGRGEAVQTLLRTAFAFARRHLRDARRRRGRERDEYEDIFDGLD